MDKRLERILPRVQKPARYTGGEYNQILKDRYAVELRVAFCFPDTYEIGMSNLGMSILYHTMNSLDYVWCERVFAPWGDMYAEMRKAGLPLYALESGDSLDAFDVLAFSVGLAGGRLLMRRLGESSLFWPMAILLTLSPLSYMLMARAPQPNQLWLLCCVTSFAQLCFGFGLNLCRVFVPYISEHRYRNTTNFLTIPMVASLMIVPMALSGWLCSRSGFATFFTVCVAMAPMAWLVLLFTRLKQILINNE